MKEEFTIDRVLYDMAQHLLSLDKLRNLGLVEGGPEVDIEFMNAVKTVGEKLGWPAISKKRTEELAVYFSRGGAWEKEQSEIGT